MLYREMIAVCSEIHTKHINTLCGQNVDLLNVKLAVHWWPVGIYNIYRIHASSHHIRLVSISRLPCYTVWTWPALACTRLLLSHVAVPLSRPVFILVLILMVIAGELTGRVGGGGQNRYFAAHKNTYYYCLEVIFPRTRQATASLHSSRTQPLTRTVNRQHETHNHRYQQKTNLQTVKFPWWM